MTLQLDTPQSAFNWCNKQRELGNRIGFVATMGALHKGHISLIRRAVADCDIVCASIFVNPLQFNDPKDLERYPRNAEKDAELLVSAGCHMVFTGQLTDFFPGIANINDIKLLDPGLVGMGLEGNHRPGHFAGVKTIVNRLFETVGPCTTYFGEKDFQQTLVIKQLAAELGYPEVIVCPTIRESNGLAMSSRNELLTPPQREQAACIFSALSATRDLWNTGERNALRLGQFLHSRLTSTDVVIEYAQVRDPHNWQAEPADHDLSHARAFVAVKFGKVRLIDNLCLSSK